MEIKFPIIFKQIGDKLTFRFRDLGMIEKQKITLVNEVIF